MRKVSCSVSIHVMGITYQILCLMFYFKISNSEWFLHVTRGTRGIDPCSQVPGPSPNSATIHSLICKGRGPG